MVPEKSKDRVRDKKKTQLLYGKYVRKIAMAAVVLI